MKYTIAVVAAVALAALSPLNGQASGIAWDTGQPISPAAGKVTGSGTYTLDAGFKVTSMMIVAQPDMGGQYYFAGRTYANGAFTGGLVGLPSGSKFKVYVQMMIYNSSTGKEQSYVTAQVDVTIK